MLCYEDLLNRTSQKNAPWYVIPADDKATARLLVAKTILETLKKYKDIQYPTIDKEAKKNIEIYKNELNNET